MSSESSTLREQAPFRVVIAGGGTGGHISPAVAVAAELQARGPVDLHWIGSRNGFERDAAREREIPFYQVRTGKLRRYFALETIGDAFRVPAGILEARRILKRLKPDVIFSTGGFVSTPTVIAGRSLGIPSLTHEQTASLGLATRINARFCDTVALSFPNHATLKTRPSARVVVTGNPVRPWILNGDRHRFCSLFGIPPELPVVYVTGGAQGAHALNTAIGGALPELLKTTAIIHQCGPQSGNGDFQRLLDLRQQLDAGLQDRYVPVERVGDELAHIYASATLVVGRAGAGTVAELAAVGLPSILVPLPGADEQRRNAAVLESAGGAVVIDETDLTPGRLLEEVTRITANPELRAQMARAACSSRAEDPAGKLCDELIRLARQ